MTQPTPTEEVLDTLVKATNLLSERVAILTEATQVGKQQSKVNRNVVWALLGLLFFIAAVGGFEQHRISIAVDQNTATANQQAEDAKQQCKNDNDQRAANLALWQFVLDVSARPDQTDEEKAQVSAIRTWIVALYAPHDCDNLSEVYTIPDPPDLSGVR